MKSNETNDLSVIANNIEKALASLDDVKRATALPFLYIRIHARLNAAQFSSKDYCFIEKIGFFFSRPIIAVSFLLFIFLIDGLAIQSTSKSPWARSENSEEQYLRNNGDSDEALFYGNTDSEWDPIY